jgi:hypothetical protein
MKGVKAHYIVHKMLSQSNFCKILKIVIDHVIKYNQLNEKGLNIIMFYRI